MNKKTKCFKCKSEYFLIDHGIFCGGCGEVCDIEEAKKRRSQIKKSLLELDSKIKRAEFFRS